MAKNWTTIYTNADETKVTKEEITRRMHRFDNTIKSMKSPTYDELKRSSEIAYAVKLNEEEKLLQAFSEKKVKSKAAIKQALRIKRERAAAEKKEQEQKENPKSVPEVVAS